MIYSANVQNINFILKYVVFLATQKMTNVLIWVCIYPNPQIFIRFFLAQNIKNFILKICMLVGYIIDHVKICFRFFETYKHEFWFFFQTERSLELGSKRHFPELFRWNWSIFGNICIFWVHFVWSWYQLCPACGWCWFSLDQC
jgi:hypothetical protein